MSPTFAQVQEDMRPQQCQCGESADAVASRGGCCLRLSSQFLPLLRTLAFSLANFSTYCQLSILVSPQDLFGAQTLEAVGRASTGSCEFPSVTCRCVWHFTAWIVEIYMKCRSLHLWRPGWLCQFHCCVQILWPRHWLGQDLSKLVGNGEKKVWRCLAPIGKNCGCLHAWQLPLDLAHLFLPARSRRLVVTEFKARRKNTLPWAGYVWIWVFSTVLFLCLLLCLLLQTIG